VKVNVPSRRTSKVDSNLPGETMHAASTRVAAMANATAAAAFQREMSFT
jgi:hypothetical protein